MAAADAASSTPTPSGSAAAKADKVNVEVKAVPGGGVRQPKKAKYRLNRSHTFASAVKLLRDKVFKTPVDKELFVYVQQAFAPSGNQTMGELFDHFRTGSTLVLYCGEAEAYG